MKAVMGRETVKARQVLLRSQGSLTDSLSLFLVAGCRVKYFDGVDPGRLCLVGTLNLLAVAVAIGVLIEVGVLAAE